jgi:N-acetylmuramoyl-L-alanine amidase CwlA
MKITKQLTKYNHNTASRGKGDIKYIVMHWVGAVSSAKNNAAYFGGGNRGASAHYFVDATSIYQVVADKDIAWHCGGGLQDQGSSLKKYGAKLHGKATNNNSIGIEMCLDKGSHIAADTYKNAAELVESLQAKYGIDDAHVIRHFDVTGKLCPGTLVKDADWAAWKAKYIAAPKPAAPAPAFNKYKVKTTAALNVRKKADDKSTIVDTLKKGTSITVIGKATGTSIKGNKTWLKISNGYIAEYYTEKS